MELNDFDFKTMHHDQSHLFLYTGEANMSGIPQRVTPRVPPKGFPESYNSFALFKAANMFLVPDLESEVEELFVEACSQGIICSRLFRILRWRERGIH
jgi:hypothetical protein